jgi:ribosomal protein S18 acetylase RimI-like enzyme
VPIETYVIRAAREDESDAVARLHRLVRTVDLPYLPILHTPQEDSDYFSSVVFPGGDVWVADTGQIVGYCATVPGWIEHLYVHPDYQRQGIGTALLEKAMEADRDLQLWMFARNEAARSFYTKHGFREVTRTDGDNEEKEPDVLMRWAE